MTSALTTKPTSLNKCLLGIGIPLTKEAFIESLQTENQKDFIKSKIQKQNVSNSTLWDLYKQTIVNTSLEILKKIEKIGVTVICDFSLKHLQLIENYETTTIIGHWVENQEKIELADGTHSILEFTNAIPQDIECMLDLTVCQSEKLLSQIKKRNENIYVRCFSSKVDFRHNLLYYQLIINILKNDKKLNFLEARNIAIKQIFNNL